MDSILYKSFRVILLLLLFPSFLYAETLVWHVDQIVSPQGFGCSQKVHIDGNIVIAAWNHNDDIYANRSTDAGVSWLGAQPIYIADEPGTLDLAQSGNNVVVVFDDGGRIHSNYSTDGGVTWHSEQIIDSYGDSHSVQVALSGNRAVEIFRGRPNSTDRIFANFSLDGRKTWNADMHIDTDSGYDAADHQIAVSDSIYRNYGRFLEPVPILNGWGFGIVLLVFELLLHFKNSRRIESEKHAWLI